MIKLVLAKDIDFKNWKIQFFTALNQVVFPMYQKIILEIGFECKNLLNFICNTMKFNPILPEGGGAVMAHLPWIRLPLPQGQGYHNQSSWLCSFWYLPGPRKPVLVFVFQKIKKIGCRKFFGVLEH